MLKVKAPERILNVIPTARTFQWKGATLVAVPHKLDEVKVLRNLGIDAPSPILTYYDWPRNPYSVPQPFHAQLETAAFFTYYNRAYCLNGLGSGKTLSTLWAYDYLRSQGKVRRMLVVTTLSTVDRTWGDSIFEHFNHLTFTVVHASSRDRRLKLLDQKVDIYIVNHDGLKVIGPQLAERDDIDLVVVDEISEAARNSQTDRWEALHWAVSGKPATRDVTEELTDARGNPILDKDGFVKKRTKKVPLGKPGPVRMAWGLTATPIPVEPTDAWAQCRLITPETAPAYYNKFREMVMRQAGPFKWVARDNALDVVHKVMQPAIRFSREECVDLPPTTYTTREVPLTPEQDKAYREMKDKLAAEVEAGQILAVNEAVKVMRLVQIACGVATGADGEEVTIPSKPRLEEVLRVVQESQSKTIVFVPFISSLTMVAEFLRKAGYEVGVVYGAVSKAARNDIFTAFQRGSMQVIVAQPAAMSHGLTLVAASTIVWYAPTNRPDVYEQSNGRIVRPGQKHNTLIVHIEGTPIERKMYKRLQDKQAFQGILLDMVVTSRGKATT